MSMSSPASADATVEWVAPQSDVTKPPKPNPDFSAPFRIDGCSQANVPLITLNEHITEDAAPSPTDRSNAGR